MKTLTKTQEYIADKHQELRERKFEMKSKFRGDCAPQNIRLLREVNKLLKDHNKEWELYNGIFNS